ncbi:MAG TPA: transglycosylase domain-containing protein [Gallionella sp.]|nr:transglycosylase domain-containing protein [Gallionella sp.]
MTRKIGRKPLFTIRQGTNTGPAYLRALKFLSRPALLIPILVAGWIIINEVQSSGLQARYFSHVANGLKYELADGISSAIRFPKAGPYDERLGYTRIPEFTRQLTGHEFIVSKQVRMSPELFRSQLPPIYPEKDRVGLELFDNRQQSFCSARSPKRGYSDFDAIPRVLTETLLFIEDRELLDARYPMRNPAVNWTRLNRAVFDQVIHTFYPSHEAPGASTLVTQIEKYRHSPDGRTRSAGEKLLQMKAASIRAYMDGENNIARRRQTVVTYLNTVPLSSKAGYGEINGFGDGMWAWYGRDLSEINDLLNRSKERTGEDQLRRTAEAYKQALSLIIAQRRPSYYLMEGAPVLMKMTNTHLRLLGEAGIIPPELVKAALPLPLQLNQRPISEPKTSFVSAKAANSLRTDLSSLLRISLYDLDRMDLTVQTTLDDETQRAITDMLHQVQDPSGAKAAGLYGHNMLDKDDNLGRLSFSFTLFERGTDANLLRVQTDSLDQPFDLNNGARLNLGSTAKLRTLITYLEIVAKLHQSYSEASPKELGKIQVDKQDALSRWALGYFSANPHQSLSDALEAAMMRTYSANPAEAFFTGGGLQRFENFEREENGRIMTVREGFQHSVNLVFIRLMRDIVRYYEHQKSGESIQRLVNEISPDVSKKSNAREVSTDSDRQAVLARFADKEGREFLLRFYKKYKGKAYDEARQTLIDGTRAQPKRLAVLFRSLEPEANFENFAAFMANQLTDATPSKQALQSLYEKYGVDKYSLNDRGYLIGIHPLELWLVGYLRQAPNATPAQVVAASRIQRQEVYEWLFKTRNKKTQDSRIHQMLELEAFTEIAADWRKLGYPFGALTPSYAAALGASGDRPSSLAELMGIIANKGMRMPVRKFQALQFAQGTPYETDFIHSPAAGIRVLPEEIAEIVRRSLFDVVQGGTGVRLKNGFAQKDGSIIEIGGKTGTGDQRFVSYAPNGRLIESRVVNRSATFVFLIGDRFFGTLTAYVHEPYAANYTFTSSLMVQLLKSLIPALQPIVAQSGDFPHRSKPEKPRAFQLDPVLRHVDQKDDSRSITKLEPRLLKDAAQPVDAERLL